MKASFGTVDSARVCPQVSTFLRDLVTPGKFWCTMVNCGVLWEAPPRNLRPGWVPKTSPRNTAPYDPFRAGIPSPRLGPSLLSISLRITLRTLSIYRRRNSIGIIYSEAGFPQRFSPKKPSVPGVIYKL